MGNCYNYTPIPPAEASCIIAHLFVELALPCSCCKREDGVIVIQGKTYDGSSARVTIKGEEVRYYGKQRTLAAIRAGQCRPPALGRDKLPEMQVITDAKELEKHTYIKTRNSAVFPKKERLGLAQRMMNEASDLVADLMEANDLLLTDPEERELRYRAQRSALRNCRKLIHHIELAHEILSGFSDDAFAYWAKMAAGVKNQTAKWYKTDKERAAKLDAQKRHQ